MSNPYAANAVSDATGRERTQVPGSPHYVAQAGLHADAPAVAPRLQAVALRKSYRKGQVEIPVLRGVNFDVKPGEFVSIIGASGSGKSTLLHLLGLLDGPDAGDVRFDGADRQFAGTAARRAAQSAVRHDLSVLSPAARAEHARECARAADDRGRGVELFAHRRRLAQEARELLDVVGLGHRLRHRPRELSGGEMQRTAIARALVMRPQVLLADEPTGNLDRATGREILRILRTLNAQENLTIVMVTHDLAIAEEADRIVRLCEGGVEGA